MKKVLGMVMAVIIAAGTFAGTEIGYVGTVAVADDDPHAGEIFSEGDLKYTILADGSLKVRSLSDSGKTSAKIEIPPEVQKRSVTVIGSNAFEQQTGITEVTIPNSVTAVESSAFSGCTGLSSVTIPGSVKDIGSFAFESCTGLTAVTLSEGIESIGNSAFRWCTGLEKADIPNGVTSIGTDAFLGCTALTEATIPASVTDIGGRAFDHCSSLTAINVDENNEAYCSVDGVLFNKDKTKLIQYALGNKEGSYTVPLGVTTIDWSSFAGSKTLTSVTIPGTVNLIYLNAFEDCENLTAIMIPVSVAVISKDAFKGCTGINEVNYSGTEEQWKKISIGSGNEALTGATINYESYDSSVSAPCPVEVTIKTPETGAPETGDLQAQATSSDKDILLTFDEDGNLDISEVSDGKYTFTFSAANCAPRAYEVTVSGGAVTGLENGVELHLLGDITGDGVVNTQDVAKANAHVKGTSLLKDYELACINVNNDENINVQDVALMNAHAKNTKMLW